jgi:hypothetical protein
MGEKTRTGTTPLAQGHVHLLRVVHQVPQRVRLRPHVGRWSHEQCDRLAAALRRTAGVQGYRLSAAGQSLTVEHSAPVHVVLAALESAIARPPSPRTQPARARDAGAGRRRSAARRLLLCAVVSLAIALLPEPVAPAMIVLRLLACGITAAVRYHAEQQAQAGGFTRVLEALAGLVGVVRAGSIVRALLQHCVASVLQRWAEKHLREALAARRTTLAAP